jgi:hypothetical protein
MLEGKYKVGFFFNDVCFALFKQGVLLSKLKVNGPEVIELLLLVLEVDLLSQLVFQTVDQDDDVLNLGIEGWFHMKKVVKGLNYYY